MGEKAVLLAPSLICSDLCNIEQSVKQMEALGVDLLHIDLLDAHFSPSMPLGLGSVEQLRRKTALPFDVHLMVENNAFFIDEMIAIGCERLCFHYESVDHADYLLNKLKRNGIKAGIALKPSTTVAMLDEILPECDYIMLMLINPGFAGQKGESIIPYACRKINRLREMIKESGRKISIEVDGRVTLENLPELLEAGADTIVCGTGTLFRKDFTLQENMVKLKQVIGGWENGKAI